MSGLIPTTSSSDPRRYERSLRPRRMADPISPATMATVPVAGPSTQTPISASSNAQYVTRSATGSLSRVKREIDASTSPEEDGGGAVDLGDMDAQEKLERKREKNRVKQRNLRLRRNIQLKDLEDQVEQVSRDAATTRNQLKTLTANEARYTGWVQELEAALLQQGLGTEVERVRKKWSREIVPVTLSKAKSSGRKGKGKAREPVSYVKAAESDPLSTLAQAAMSTGDSLGLPDTYRGQDHTDKILPYPPPPHPSRSLPLPQATTRMPRPDHPLQRPHSYATLSTQQRAHPGHQAINRPPHSPEERRRPSTSYTQPSPAWPHPTHPALKRKRSVSGPITHAPPTALPPLHSRSEPASAHRPFEALSTSTSSITLPPLLSLPGIPDPAFSSSSLTVQPSPSSSILLAPIRPMTAPSTPPRLEVDLIGPSLLRSSTPQRSRRIDDLLISYSHSHHSDSSQPPGPGRAD